LPFGALKIAGNGLVYCSEKSYEMVESVNFVIANARRKIPDFGLKGALRAVTEFEPHLWWLKIADDGWARQVKFTDAERQVYAAEQDRQAGTLGRLFDFSGCRHCKNSCRNCGNDCFTFATVRSVRRFFKERRSARTRR
jgi:hypothetical protein